MPRRLVTANALLTCTHDTGIVQHQASQQLVRIGGALVLVDPDTVGKTIVGCPNTIPGATVACSRTLELQQGRSTLAFVGGRPILLDDLTGFNVCQPPLSAQYQVHGSRNGQALVRELP